MHKRLRLSVGQGSYDETAQQQQRDNVVASNAVGHGVASNALSSAKHIGVKERLARKIRLAVIFRQTDITKAFAHRLPRQVQGVGALAPGDIRRLDMRLHGRVLLCGRSVTWQPRQHLPYRRLPGARLLQRVGGGTLAAPHFMHMCYRIVLIDHRCCLSRCSKLI